MRQISLLNSAWTKTSSAWFVGFRSLKSYFANCLIFVGLNWITKHNITDYAQHNLLKTKLFVRTLFKEVIRCSKQCCVASLLLYVRNQSQVIAQLSRFSFALCLQLSCAYQNVKSYFENRVSRVFSSQQSSLLQSSYTKFTAPFEIASLFSIFYVNAITNDFRPFDSS